MQFDAQKDEHRPKKEDGADKSDADNRDLLEDRIDYDQIADEEKQHEHQVNLVQVVDVLARSVKQVVGTANVGSVAEYASQHNQGANADQCNGNIVMKFHGNAP